MVLLSGLGLALLIVMAFGGRLGRLADLRIRWMWLVYAAFGDPAGRVSHGNMPWSTRGVRRGVRCSTGRTPA